MDFTPQQKYSLLSKMGYTGSMQGDEMDKFLQSNPGAAAKMGKFNRALQRGFQTGGVVAPAGSTSPLTGLRQSYANAMDKLAKVQQEANAWSISGIETKKDKTSTVSTASRTQQPSRPSISQKEAYEYITQGKHAEKVKASGLPQYQLRRKHDQYYIREVRGGR